MSTRPDGMPEGHPEKRSIPLAQLTISSASTDLDDPSFDIHGELRILVPTSPDNSSATLETVRSIMRKVLDTETVATFTVPRTSCGCGNHHDGGDGQ